MNNLILNNIHVQFFKSVGSATIEIPELAVFVGKNAAGKSNIVSVFRFLRDLADKGLTYAVQQQEDCLDILIKVKLFCGRKY